MQTECGPSQPLIEWVPGARCRAGKRSERESNHLTPSNEETNIAMSYTYAFMARTGTNVPGTCCAGGKKTCRKGKFISQHTTYSKGESDVLKHST